MSTYNEANATRHLDAHHKVPAKIWSVFPFKVWVDLEKCEMHSNLTEYDWEFFPEQVTLWQFGWLMQFKPNSQVAGKYQLDLWRLMIRPRHDWFVNALRTNFFSDLLLYVKDKIDFLFKKVAFYSSKYQHYCISVMYCNFLYVHSIFFTSHCLYIALYGSNKLSLPFLSARSK